jgi:hypothetical protein
MDAGTAAVRGAPAAGGPPAAGTGDDAVDPGAVAGGAVVRAVGVGAAAGDAAAGACAPAEAVSTGALGPMNQTAGPPRGGSIGIPSGSACAPVVHSSPNATIANFPGPIKGLAS